MTRVVVEVMPKPELSDPQGTAILHALPRLQVTSVLAVRQGRRFEIEWDGPPEEALAGAHEVAARLLANPVIEDFTVHLAGG